MRACHESTREVRLRWHMPIILELGSLGQRKASKKERKEKNSIFVGYFTVLKLLIFALEKQLFIILEIWEFLIGDFKLLGFH